MYPGRQKPGTEVSHEQGRRSSNHQKAQKPASQHDQQVKISPRLVTPSSQRKQCNRRKAKYCRRSRDLPLRVLVTRQVKRFKPIRKPLNSLYDLAAEGVQEGKTGDLPQRYHHGYTNPVKLRIKRAEQGQRFSYGQKGGDRAYKINEEVRHSQCRSGFTATLPSC